ncbi:MAG: HD domain-containing protein [Candidatus Paceibacterota bacterium]
MTHIEVAKMIATEAEKMGWDVFAVGGFVRDTVLEAQSKDLDLEVFGPDSVESLIEFLSVFGEVDAVGKSFGVLKLKVNGIDLDVSLPRTESKDGKGHKGFVVKSDSKLTPLEASLRRDFTFNALMMKLPECEIVDLHSGIGDIVNRRLRHTSEHFADDPLRVLRGMQFCGRFNLTADKETCDLSRSLLPEFEELAKERLWVEFEKWAVKSVKPSKGLVFLFRSGWLKKFPELFALVGCEQSKEYHAEGSVWQHTKLVVDNASQIAEREHLNSEHRLILVLAALLHDVGKPNTTDKEVLSAHQHAREGEEIAQRFLESIDAPKHIVKAVCSMVKHHMSYATTSSGVRRLSNNLEVPLSLLMLLMEADTKGRITNNVNRKSKSFEKIEKMGKMASELNVRDEKPQPILMGRHLIEIGMKPGKQFGEILNAAFELQLDGKINTLEEAKQWLVSHTN